MLSSLFSLKCKSVLNKSPVINNFVKNYQWIFCTVSSYTLLVVMIVCSTVWFKSLAFKRVVILVYLRYKKRLDQEAWDEVESLAYKDSRGSFTKVFLFTESSVGLDYAHVLWLWVLFARARALYAYSARVVCCGVLLFKNRFFFIW